MKQKKEKVYIAPEIKVHDIKSILEEWNEELFRKAGDAISSIVPSARE